MIVWVVDFEEMWAFWSQHRIDTMIDWAGTIPQKATVSRSELVEHGDAAVRREGRRTC